MHHIQVLQNALHVLFYNGRWPAIKILRRFQNIAVIARPVIRQPLLTALDRDFTRLQIMLRQPGRQHGVFTRQYRHGIDMLNDKLAVRHPHAHIFQILPIKAGFA